MRGLGGDEACAQSRGSRGGREGGPGPGLLRGRRFLLLQQNCEIWVLCVPLAYNGWREKGTAKVGKDL